ARSASRRILPIRDRWAPTTAGTVHAAPPHHACQPRLVVARQLPSGSSRYLLNREVENNDPNAAHLSCLLVRSRPFHDCGRLAAMARAPTDRHFHRNEPSQDLAQIRAALALDL